MSRVIMTGVLESVSSAGFFPGVLLTGLALSLWSGRDRFFERLSVSPALGLLIWTAPMLVMAGLSLYRPWQFGLAGWIVTVLLFPTLFTRFRREPIVIDPVGVLVVVVAAAYGAWSFLYTGETFLGGRDQGGYSNHALHLARTGSLWIDFPFESFAEARFGPMHFLQNLSNLGFTLEGMQAQFPPAYTIWMAQAIGVFGRVGAIGLNPVLVALTVPLFYGLTRRFLDRPASLVALCVFLLTPTQIWMPRITLSEIAAQHFVFAAMLLITGGWLDRSVRSVVFGGLLLGGVYWVRIDGLVIAPIMIVALAAARSWGEADEAAGPLNRTMIRRLGWTVFAALGLGSLSHYLTSGLYFESIGPKLVRIALLTALLIPVSLLSLNTRVMGWLARLSRQRLVLLAVIGLLVGLVAWASWIRPVMEPFQLNPRDPTKGRTFSENSLVNIVAYLTQPGALLTFIGLIAAVWAFLRGRMNRAWYIPFAIWGGYTLLYVYDPNISPDHIWAMRRFVPVILPGCALLAGLGFATLTRGIRTPSGRGFGAFMVCAILAVIMLRGSSVFAFFKEYRGADTFWVDLDSRIPTDSIVFADTSTLFFDPLYPGLGHRVVRVNLADLRMPALIDQVIRENAPDGASVYYLVQPGNEFLIEAERVDPLVLEYEYIAPTTEPPPRERRRHVHHLSLVESKSAPQTVTAGLGNVTVGTHTLAGIEESGFHGPESNEFGPFRWTTERWSLKIPLREGYRPRSVSLNIGGLPPQGCNLLVVVNGVEIHRVFYPSAPGRIEMDLPTDFTDSVLDLRVENDTFVPAKVMEGNSDQRALGLMLYGVSLSDQPASKGIFELGSVPKPGVEEGGFHDPEINESGPYRWTDGAAWLELPLPSGYVVRAIDVSILDISPAGTDLEFLLNDEPVHRYSYASPPGMISIDVTDFSPTSEGDVLRLDLRSTTFRPVDLGMGSDERVLGVRVHGIVISDRQREE